MAVRGGPWLWARLCTQAAGLVAAVGVAFLGGMFAAFAVGATPVAMTLGRINDVLILVAYPLAIPGLLGLWLLVRRQAPVLSGLAVALGIASIAAISGLQALLVREVLTFSEQVGPVSLALLGFGAALVLLGAAGRSAGLLPGGVRMGLVGATYVGFPLWARWAARELGRASAGQRESTAPPSPTSTSPSPTT